MMIVYLNIFMFCYNQSKTAGYKRSASSSLPVIICNKDHILLCTGEGKKE